MGGVTGGESQARLKCSGRDDEIGVVARMPSVSSVDPKVGRASQNRNRNLEDVETAQAGQEIREPARRLVCPQAPHNLVVSDRRKTEPLLFGEILARSFQDASVFLLEDLGENVGIKQSSIHALGQVSGEVGPPLDVTIGRFDLFVGKPLEDIWQAINRLSRREGIFVRARIRLNDVNHELLARVQAQSYHVLQCAAMR